ncbi:hypothetical protein CNMCM8980_002253 [Aspergillus fumigatiaffinis]|uniref:Protein kinase domain-containing protein n=1 Tax=Aspergillus fumigatiaffinis TaxID=340414 RepID=A0A8H4HEG4_9EURO|nr:hypothetical protein CNMCM6457_005329 [Aspergillus fumigatiaffinis]KAF4243655.1 hypothetical protein CNMCM6805_000378 [Aspergillus fumigatiaffinis]KAF4249928.1 hypothetical protein CNMCM8980_002253 [Aspergillus fumigatiaffinis]
MRKEEIKLLCERFTTLLGDRFSKNHREERFVPHGAAQEVFRNYKSDLQELLQHVSEALRADEGLLVSVAHRILESLSNVLAIVLMARARNDMFVLNCFLSLILDGNNHVREFLILTDSELPISKARAEELFPDRGAAFFTTQLHFCAIVLQEEKEVKYLEKEQRLCPLPYLRQELIGEGAFGQVYAVEIERHHMRSASGDGENRKPTLLARKDFRLQHAFEEELKVLRKIMRRPERHDHLVPLLAILQHDATYSLFFPLAVCDLTTYFDRQHDPPGRGALDENKALYHRGVALAGALAFLHHGFSDMSCYHLDLKPRNILVYNAHMADEVWKITDFGLSRVRVKAQSPNDGDSTMTIGVQGTYLAPECAVAGAKVSALSDVWSFGCIFSLVLTFMVKGGKGITEFSTRRAEQPNGDLFYTNPTEPQVSPAVITWFDHLKRSATNQLGPAIGSAADIRFFDFTSNGQYLVMVTQEGTINFGVKVWETRGDTLFQEMLIPHRGSAATTAAHFTACTVFMLSGILHLFILSQEQYIIHADLSERTWRSRELEERMVQLHYRGDNQTLLFLKRDRRQIFALTVSDALVEDATMARPRQIAHISSSIGKCQPSIAMRDKQNGKVEILLATAEGKCNAVDVTNP